MVPAIKRADSVEVRGTVMEVEENASIPEQAAARARPRRCRTGR